MIPGTAGGGRSGPDELERLVADGLVRTVRLMAMLPDGRLVGKFVSASHLLRMQPALPNVADIVFGFDRSNQPSLTWESWRGPLAELYLAPDFGSLVVDPRLDGLASVLCSFAGPDGTPIAECPRGQVHRLTGELAERGLEVRAGFEIEFSAFDESIATARGRGYRRLTPLGGSAETVYAVTKERRVMAFLDAVTRRFEQLGLHWESWLDEMGAGQFEFNLEPDEACRLVDDIVRARLAIREVADEHGLCVTFMAKWHPDQAGGGLHLNHSLWRDGTSAFFDPEVPDARSDAYRHWLGGLMATMRGAQAFCFPNVNSYRRLVEMNGPPTTVTWSGDNKTAAIRAMSQSPASARIELRTPGADANPYLVMAAALAGGLAGLDEQLDPGPPFAGMAWALPPSDGLALAKSITAAADALDGDTRLRRWLGDDLVDHWIGHLRNEWLAFHTTGGDPDAAVSDWELRRYFENV